MGALGPVFRTYEPERDRLVAVKVFRLDVPPEQARALADELARVAEAGLFHPSIVEPIAAGVEGSLAYCAVEYVTDESLDVAMRDYAPAPIDTVLPFITQLAGAIDFARAAGVGHGALHPRDVFVTPAEARATGFGVVEALERVGLRAPVRRPYSPPERIAGDAWSTPADVFSLAAIAYELLTGRRPAGLGEEIGSLTAGTPNGWMEGLHAVLARAMDEDPDRRYPAALALASALETAARGEYSAPVAVPASAVSQHEAAPGETPFDAIAAEPVSAAYPADEPGDIESRAELRYEAHEDLQPPEADEAEDIVGERDEDQAHQRLTLDEMHESVARDARTGGEELDPEAHADRFLLDAALAAATPARGSADEFRTPYGVQPSDELRIGYAAEPDTSGAPDTFEDSGAFGESRTLDESSTVDEARTLDEPGSFEEATPFAASREFQESSAFEEDEVVTDAPLSAAFLPEDVRRGAAATGPADERFRDFDDRIAPVEERRFDDDVPAPVYRPPYQGGAARGYAPAAREWRGPWLVVLLLVGGLLAALASGYAIRRSAPAAPEAGETLAGGGGVASDPAATPPAEPSPTDTEASVQPPAAAAPQPRGTGPAALRDVVLPPEKPSPPASATVPAPAPAPRVTHGTLIVRSTPSGAGVTLNGTWRGRTPLTLPKLPLARYQVRIVEPGYAPVSETVTLSVASPERTVSASLQQQGKPAPRAAQPAQRGASPAARGGQAPAGPAEAFTGSVYVDSRPRGATVTINGQPMGVTPLRIPEMRIGTHVVRLELADHQIWSSTARVTAGQEVRVTGSLEPIR